MKKLKTLYGWMLMDKDTGEIVGDGGIFWWYQSAVDKKKSYGSPQYLIKIVKVKISQV